MSVSVATGASVQASVASTKAAYAATQIKMLRCEGIMKQPDLSSVVSRRAYSECVAYMEPEASWPPSPEAKMQVSALAALLVVFMIAGAFIGKRDPYTGWGMGIFLGVMAYFATYMVLSLGLLFVDFLMA
jgi:hypothetical protein